MSKAGIEKGPMTMSSDSIDMTLTDSHVVVGDIRVERSNPLNIEKVPRPLFYDNSAHRIALETMLRTHLSERYNSILLIGNQGVGKNKLVDQMLHMLRREREYIQLHRDTTVQSLTMLPTLQDGRVVYQDSPLMQAAKTGRVLVIDEADKAPIEVLCLLKMLVEDGELILHDGRRLLSQQRIQQEYSAGNSSDIIPIHPNFRLIVLANRPGYPFHGNNLFRECGDIFSVQVVENLDLSSEISLLQAYGPDIPLDIIQRIALAFQDLRLKYENHEFSYPYSAREAVSVIRHIQHFPEDGVAAAVENILGFDGYNPRNRKLIALIFQARGIPVPITPDHSDSSSTSSKNYFELIQSRISIAPSLPILDPISYNTNTIKMEAGSISSTISNLVIKPWTSNSFQIKPFSVHPSRVFSFSEELGRLYVGDPKQSAYSGKFNGMIVDRVKPNVFHVLTSFPLELHSYYPAQDEGDISFFSGIGEGKCVTRLLIDPEIQWRIGDPEVFMSPLPDGGVCVFLYEHGTALIIRGNDPNDIQPIVQTQIAPMSQKKSSGVSNSTLPSSFSDKIIQSMKSSLQNVYDKQSNILPVTEPLTIYKYGQEQFHLLDFNMKKLATISTPNLFIRNISPFCSPDRLSSNNEIFQWIVTGEIYKGNKTRLGHTIVSYSIRDGTSSLSEFTFTPGDISLKQPGDPFQVSGGWDEFKSNQWKIGNKTISSELLTSSDAQLNQFVGWSGSSHLHFGALAVTSSMSTRKGEMILWPRSTDTTIPESIIPGNNFPPTYVINGLLTHQKGANILLEVVNVENNTRKEINLSGSSSSSITRSEMENTTSSRAGSLISVTSLHSPNGNKMWSIAATLDSLGCVRFFEIDSATLDENMKNWKQMMGITDERNTNGQLDKQRDHEMKSNPRFGVDKPKHGKEDEKNEPHVGGNTWAGGTGGSDTAGLGGRGGPYRLDKGHTVHQVSELEKKISAEGKARAAEMAKIALEQRMKEINLGKSEFQSYERFRLSVQSQVTLLRQILQELTSRSHERKWLKNQQQGELDDSKLVDGLTGEKLVFKRRGVDLDVIDEATDGSDNLVKKRLQFVMDVSGSMYRFNSQDRRLERMLEAALMIMSSIPNENTIEYSITGHSGDTANITFVPYHCTTMNEEKPRFQVLQKMVAHSQFCQAGDNTLESAAYAVKNILTGAQMEEQCQRYVFVLSDANFERYGITSSDIRKVLNKDSRVQVHFIFIASSGDEANRLAETLPKGRIHLCYESTDLPAIFKKILTSYGGAFDTL